MKEPKVYLRGNTQTPQRFWVYALVDESDEETLTRYKEEGFVLSKSATKEYLSLPDNIKEKIKFFKIK